MTNHSSMAMLVTWNDFGEGTMIEPTVEYGFRDLAIVQDERRRHGEPGFPFDANDLELPLRLFRLRKATATNASLAPQLDAISASIATGNLATARHRLETLDNQ